MHRRLVRLSDRADQHVVLALLELNVVSTISADPEPNACTSKLGNIADFPYRSGSWILADASSSSIQRLVDARRTRLERLRTLLGLPIPPPPDGLLRPHAHPRIQLHRLDHPEPRHHRRDEAPRRGEQPPLHRRLRPGGRAHPRRPHRADHPHGEPRLPLRRQAHRRGAVDPLPPGHHGGAGLLRHRLHDGPLQPGRAGPHLRPQRQRGLRPQPLPHLPGRRRRHHPAARHRLGLRGRRHQPPRRVHRAWRGRSEPPGREPEIPRRQPLAQAATSKPATRSAATSPPASTNTT